MKHITSILLAAVFLLQPLSKLSVLINYELNKVAITKNFCVNKSKPMMHCNGKCHLKKQLEKEDKKQDVPGSLKEKSEIQFHSMPSQAVFAITHLHISHYTHYLVIYPDKPVISIFHPPAFC